MTKLQLIFILLTIVMELPSVQAQTEQNITSEDGFILKSVIWKQDSPSDAILLLHQCDADQNMYSNLAAILFNSGFHVITFDYRGIGKSISLEFNIKEAKNKSEAWDKVALYDKRDLDAVMSFVKESLGSTLNSISLLGASCGGNKVVYLLEQYDPEIKAFGFLSSRLSSTSLEKIRKFADKPALFIAAKKDKRAYEAARTGMKYSKSTDSEIIIYDGNDHAKSLFLKDRQLEETINAWYVGVIK